jgi:hypothetical protein
LGVTTNLKLPYPELTDAVDGPTSFDALAQGVEDYFYRRILPTGVTRMPSYHWGAGVNYPTGVAVGDTFVHNSLGPSLMRWNGVNWRQVEPAEVADETTRNAISIGQTLYSGFRVRQLDVNQLLEWDAPNARWAKLPGVPIPLWSSGGSPSGLVVPNTNQTGVVNAIGPIPKRSPGAVRITATVTVDLQSAAPVNTAGFLQLAWGSAVDSTPIPIGLNYRFHSEGHTGLVTVAMETTNYSDGTPKYLWLLGSNDTASATSWSTPYQNFQASLL